MKKLHLLFFLIAAAWQIYAQNPNLAGNPGFEDDPSTFTVDASGFNTLRRTNNNFFDAVTQTSNPTTIATDITPGMWIKKASYSGYPIMRLNTTEKKSGTTGLHMYIGSGMTNSPDMTLWSNFVASQKLPNALNNSKKYRISVWAKKDATSGNVCNSLTLYMTDNTKRTILSSTISLTGGTTWTKYEAVFDIPAHVAANPTADFAVAYAGVGTATTLRISDSKTNYSGLYIDDFSIDEDKVYYRSNQSGSYATAANWDTSTDSLNWSVSTVRPTNTVNSIVEIMPGHTITVWSPQSAIITNINPGGRLTIDAGDTFTTQDLTIRSSASGTGTLLNNGTLTVTGTTTAQQYLATTRNWYISSPVSGAVAPAGYTYYQRDEAGASWTSQSFDAGDTFTHGKGYIALPASAGSTISFSGTLNTGEVTIPLTWAGASSKGFNLIGNPYPSHLRWTQAFAEVTTAPETGTAPATLIEPSIYVRTNTGGTSNSTGTWSFETYNASTGLAVPNHSLLSSGIIPPMQAFWVRAKQAGNLILTSDLTKSHGSNLLKAPALKNTDRQLIRLEVSNGTRTDETLLFFDENAENGYDRYDSPKFAEASTEVQIYTTAGNEKLVMNGLKTMPLNQEIALGFVPGSASSFSLKANEITNLPSDVRVILKDNANNGLETDLTDGVTTYTFGTAENTTDRFALIFRAPGVTTDIEKTDNLNAQVFVNAANQIVIIAPEKSDYAIYNTMGQLFAKGTIYRSPFSIHHSSGVYIVKVNNQTTRVIIK